MKYFRIAALCAAIILGIAAAPAQKLPDPQHFLFWTPPEQALGYRSIEKIFPVHVVKRGTAFSALSPDAKPFDVAYEFGGTKLDTAGYMKATNVSGLLIVQHGRIVMERYGLGRTQNDRWTSFSVGKSVTSTLIGAAIRDGYIKSLASPVTDYLPELKGSAYDGVSIGDLITMRSGVKWNEDYGDPKSDVNQFGFSPRGKERRRSR
jgi:CubicO group peptidase (beta-lactamase class C family)